MKLLLLISFFVCCFAFTSNAQITVTYGKSSLLTKTKTAPSVNKKGSKQMVSTLTRTVKIIAPENKKSKQKKKASRKKSKSIIDDDIPF